MNIILAGVGLSRFRFSWLFFCFAWWWQPSPLDAQVELGFEQQQLSQTHNFISSVYLDSEDFDCYHRRIRQEEGAQLLRVRWYGGEIDDDARRRTAEVNHEKHLPGDPGGTAGVVPTPGSKDRFLFVERKTHHEKWYGPTPSIKERFQLKRKRIGAFMDGSMDVRQELEMMVEKGHLKKEQLESSVRVALECQEMVKTQKMSPKIRTSCHRTAFQEKTNNRVRLSLDFPLYLFKETLPDSATGFWDKLASPVGLEPFPYGVLEIKTSADDPPEWVTELVAEGFLTKVHKFSKYQHSIATNFPERLEILPYWIQSVGDDDSGNRSWDDEDDTKANHRTVKMLTVDEEWPENVEPRSVVATVPQDQLPTAPRNNRAAGAGNPRAERRVSTLAGGSKTVTTTAAGSSGRQTALSAGTPLWAPSSSTFLPIRPFNDVVSLHGCAFVPHKCR